MSDLGAAFYGDDFTGSVDALLQFSRRGWAGRLFVGLPCDGVLEDAARECDVVGVAGIARSLPPERLEDEVGAALRRLACLRPGVVQYKACSTADSSPEIGSIGRVVEIARGVLGERTVPMLFAQPDFGRYTVFGHHFAAEDGHVFRLDRQPTMSTHPSTPMTESDLAVHLARQTALPIGSVPFTEYTDAAALAARIAGSRDAALVLDALDDGHLALVGGALAALAAMEGEPVLSIGSGGLSSAIAMADRRETADPPTAATGRGPVLAVSGSRSARSRRQADAAAAAGWSVRPMTFTDADAADAARELSAGRSVVLTSDDAVVAEAGEPPLSAIARHAAGVVSAAVEAGATRRVIVCGGDTSSRVVGLLGIASLSIAANPWGNVVLLRAHAADAGDAVDGVELLLKGGQVGDDDLFERIRTLS